MPLVSAQAVIEVVVGGNGVDVESSTVVYIHNVLSVSIGVSCRAVMYSCSETLCISMTSSCQLNSEWSGSCAHIAGVQSVL
jgi:hypothetical protein